jgi:hypothetical protein
MYVRIVEVMIELMGNDRVDIVEPGLKPPLRFLCGCVPRFLVLGGNQRKARDTLKLVRKKLSVRSGKRPRDMRWIGAALRKQERAERHGNANKNDDAQNLRRTRKAGSALDLRLAHDLTAQSRL